MSVRRSPAPGTPFWADLDVAPPLTLGRRGPVTKMVARIAGGRKVRRTDVASCRMGTPIPAHAKPSLR